ncbi:hypothetical protein ABGB17_11550 [Sphaerisporangium sp. B11E5]|uniref:hypothetical protein n=1 Tax=Sphaerisporangium sp. B11E5 TaxID=3153563 RepID=UPI00325DC0EF
MQMARVRQLVGEMLIWCLVVLVGSGAFLAYHYTPSGRMVNYGGSYPPLGDVPISGAYDSILRLSVDVPGGVIVRELHYNASILFALGIVVWILLGRYRHGLIALGLAALGTLAGFGAVDDLLSGTPLGEVPVVVWYGTHLLVALALGAVLVISSYREAKEQPRTLAFITLSAALTALVLYWA